MCVCLQTARLWGVWAIRGHRPPHRSCWNDHSSFSGAHLADCKQRLCKEFPQAETARPFLSLVPLPGTMSLSPCDMLQLCLPSSRSSRLVFPLSLNPNTSSCVQPVSSKHAYMHAYMYTCVCVHACVCVCVCVCVCKPQGLVRGTLTDQKLTDQNLRMFQSGFT